MASKRTGRERILAAAQSLFHEQGVAATSIDDIAEAANVSKATVYHHFDSKDELVNTIVEALSGFYENRVIPALTRPRGAEAVRETMAFSARFLREQRGDLGCPIGALAMEHADADGPARERLAGVFRSWRDALDANLSTATAEGRLPSGADPRQLAALTLAAYQGASLVARTTKDVSFVEDVSGALMDLLVERGAVDTDADAHGTPDDAAPAGPPPHTDPLEQPWLV